MAGVWYKKKASRIWGTVYPTKRHNASNLNHIMTLNIHALEFAVITLSSNRIISLVAVRITKKWRKKEEINSADNKPCSGALKLDTTVQKVLTIKFTSCINESQPQKQGKKCQ